MDNVSKAQTLVPEPVALLAAHNAQLAARYADRRRMLPKAEALVRAIDEAIPVPEKGNVVKQFLLGRLDALYGAGSGQACLSSLVRQLEAFADTRACEEQDGSNP